MILGVAFCLAVLVAVVLGLAATYLSKQTVTASAPRPFAGPQLETREAQELESVRAAQRKKLDEYAWTDRSRGVVRIPVARAMQIIAAEGKRAYEPQEPSSEARKGGP